MSEDGYSDSCDDSSIDLIIETLAGTSFEMKVYPSDTVLDIKNKIQRVEGIPVPHQNLLYRLNELKDHSRLSELNIQNGSVFKLVLSMRGGPISTRRLPNNEQHIWKNLKEIFDNDREEVEDKISSGSKVSVLVFKEGDIINLIRVIENETEVLFPVSESSSSSSRKTNSREDTRASFCTKLKENDEMLAKLTELRKKMSALSLRRNLRQVGCSSDTSLNLARDEPSTSSSRKKSMREPHKSQSFYDLTFKLLEDMDKGYDSESDTSIDLKISDLPNEEDSIALKEKHRGNKGKHNFLYTNLSETILRPERKIAQQLGIQYRRKSEDSIFSVENREIPNCSYHSAQCYKKVKLSPKSTRKETVTTSASAPALDEKVTIWSPLSPLISRSRRARPLENSVNLPEAPCQIDLSSSSPSSSIAILEEEEAENDDKELLSPIGFPCVGTTVSMSKMPVHLDENCDIYSTKDRSKFGLLRRRSSQMTNQDGDKLKSLFEETDLILPHFVPMGPSAIPNEYTPREDPLRDFYHINCSKYLRSPLYRRQSQITDEKGVKPRNLRHFSWNADIPTGEKTNKETQKSDKKETANLPAVVTKTKKIRCELCNKRLNITNMYDCRCGGIFCSQHRYAEVHGCKYDYKTEGYRMLRKQNPLVVAEKLHKL